MSTFDVLVIFRSIVAVAGDGFAVIASDTRLSTGYSIYTRDQPKLFTLTKGTVLGCSGCWCDVLSETRLIDARMKVNDFKSLRHE